MADTIIKTGPVDSMAFSYNYVVTADDLTNGAILFDFQVDRALAMNVQFVESNGYIRDMNGCIVTLPKTGQVRVAENSALPEKTDITTVADVAGSLGGKYFTMNDPSTAYYVWYDTGASIDPAPGGTGIQVIISDDDTAEVVAGLTQIAIDAEVDFSATVIGAIISVINANAGDVTDAADVDAGVSVDVKEQGKDIDGSPFTFLLYDNIHVCASDESSDIIFIDRDITRRDEIS